MKILNTLILASTASLISMNAIAEDGSAWKSEAELGFIKTDGNSETQTLNLKAAASNSTDARTYNVKAEKTKTESAAAVTSDRMLLSGKGEFNLSENSYLFGLITYEDDRFSGYDQQTTENFGYGHKLIKEEDLKLNVEAGAGARQTETTAGTSDSNNFIRVAGNLEWVASKTATITEELSIESGDDVTITKSVTALKNSINSKLSSKISYTYKNTSDVAPGIETTDTELAVTLVYSF